MAYREITVIEIKEALRLWLQNRMGLRPTAATVGVDRQTVRRYIDAGIEAGLVREGGEGQLTDALLGAVIELVRPERPAGHGEAWEACRAEHERIKAWLDKGQKLTKVADLLAHRGVEVPYRTLHRYAADELGFGGRGTAVPVVDGEPGHELQVDFGRLGMMFDVETGRRRAVWALTFTAHDSRHTFVWLSWRQILKDVIAGCEAAWEFCGGVFKVLIIECVPWNIFDDVPAQGCDRCGMTTVTDDVAEELGRIADAQQGRAVSGNVVVDFEQRQIAAAG